MKVFAVLVLFLAGLVPCHADTTQTWNISATCQEIISFPCFAQSLNAVFTTQMETGAFESTDFFFVFTGTEPVVTGMTGTLDGMPITFVPTDLPFGWLEGGLPEGINFMAGGMEYGAVSDIDTVLFSSSTHPGTYEFMNWSAIGPNAVPEPALFWMLLAGLFLIAYAHAQGHEQTTNQHS